MRWSTPGMRVVARSGFATKLSSNPNAKITAARRNTRPGPGLDSEMATPTMKRKNGKITSVGVRPCHSAWRSGRYTADHVPGLLTTTIAAIVNPRKASSETRRVAGMRPPPGLPAFEDRRTFVPERGDALAKILRRRADLRPARLQPLRVVRRLPVLRADRLFDRAERDRRAARDARRQPRHLGVEVAVANHARDEADLAGVVGAHVFAKHQHVERAVTADVVREPHEAHPPGGYDTEIRVAGPELRRGGRQAHVARHRDGEA